MKAGLYEARSLARDLLDVAVPMRIEQLRHTRPAQRRRVIAAWALEAADVIACDGDGLLFKARHSDDEPGTAQVFNTLAKGLAAGSFARGGVDFLGAHWESE